VNVFHDRLANTILLFNLIAGLWGMVSYLRGRGVTSNYWGILAIAELLFITQGILGASMWLGGARPARSAVHILYGAVSVISLPAYFLLTRGRDDRPASLAYGVLCLFLAGISVRAMVTGGGTV
jgi:hypothetical protein